MGERGTSVGEIQTTGRFGEYYNVAKIEYQTFGQEGFRYVLVPYWDVIDGLGGDVFHGIPGFAMELHRKKYYRINRHPQFLAERTPPLNRDDAQEIMADAGLKSFCPFEWAVRTECHGGTDNLVVRKCRGFRQEYFYRPGFCVQQIQYGDYVKIQNQRALGKTVQEYTECLLRLIGAGAVVIFEEDNRIIDHNSRSQILPVLRYQFYQTKRQEKEQRKKRAAQAARMGIYRGRRPIIISEEELRKVSRLFRGKKITEAQAMERLKLSSRSTFYRKLKKQV